MVDSGKLVVYRCYEFPGSLLVESKAPYALIDRQPSSMTWL